MGEARLTIEGSHKKEKPSQGCQPGMLAPQKNKWPRPAPRKAGLALPHPSRPTPWKLTKPAGQKLQNYALQEERVGKSFHLTLWTDCDYLLYRNAFFAPPRGFSPWLDLPCGFSSSPYPASPRASLLLTSTLRKVKKSVPMSVVDNTTLKNHQHTKDFIFILPKYICYLVVLCPFFPNHFSVKVSLSISFMELLFLLSHLAD